MRSARNYSIFLGLCLSLAILAFAASCNRDPNVRKQKMMAQGNEEFDHGKYPEAMIYYGQALQIDPHYADAHYKLAESNIKIGAWTSAFRELARTVELQPDNWPAQLELAQLTLRAGKAQDAKDRALLILRSNPKNADAQIVLSLSDAALGDSKTALQEAKDATQIAPKQPGVFINLATLQAGSGQIPAAESTLKKATTLDSTSATSLISLGKFYEQQRRWSDAANQFQAAIARAPQNPIARASLAAVYMNQGQDSLAEKTLVDAKEQLKDDPSAYRMLGDYYLGRGDYAKALAEFAALSSQHPKDAHVHKTYIQLLVMNHRLDEAAALNDELIKSAPQDAEALVLKGEIQLQRGRADESVETLQKALHIFSENAFGHYQMGLALRQKGKSQEAESEFREAVRLNPSLFEAWRGLGESAMQRGDWSSLHDIAVQLKKSAPRLPEGYLFDATAHVNQNDTASAEADLKHLIALFPNNALGYVKLGQLRIAQKRLNEAEPLFHQALSHEPGSFDAVQSLVYLDLRRGKPGDALVLLQAQLANNPNSAPLHLLEGQVFAQNKQVADAEHAFERAAELDNRNPTALALLAELQANRGARDQALATYQRAIDLSPTNLSLQVAQGSLYEASGNWQKAKPIYEKVLSAQPDNAVAANNLAYILLEHGGSVNIALNLAQTARRGMPNSPNAADTLGWAYYQNGAYSVATPILEEAVKKNPENLAYRYHLGVTYQKLSDNAHARAQFEKIIAMTPKSPVAEDARRALAELGGE
jgi:tetratricopeptide (TPR) repeat protein